MTRTFSLLPLALLTFCVCAGAHAQTKKSAAMAMAIPSKAASARAAMPPALISEPVLVKVNGQPIPVSRFNVALQIAQAQGAADSPELRSTLRAQLVAQELIRQETIKLKLQNDPFVIAAREQATQVAMAQRYLAAAIKPEAVTEEAVRARFEEIVATLGEREFKPRAIAVASEEQARELLQSLRKRESSFDDLARRYSVLPSASKGGAMDWISFKLPAQAGKSQGLPLNLANALGALAPSAMLAEPIAFDGRFYIVRLDDARPTKVPVYDDVKPALRQALETQAMERATAALMSRLINSARIEQ